MTTNENNIALDPINPCTNGENSTSDHAASPSDNNNDDSLSGEDSESNNNQFDDKFDQLFQDFINSQMDDDDEHEDEHKPEAEEQSILTSLDNLTGLTSVKEKLSTYEKIVKFNRLRLEHGLPVISTPLHAMFLGSPGTGKTTVAKSMGMMLHKVGILSKGHVVVKERANLLGQYYSDEETNTLKAIEEAQGGILFIDEAYQLYQSNDPRDPGRFVIETLMTALADESRRDWMLILAGYPDEMMRMFEMNPGLKSRIPDSNIYIFEDFTESELMEIAENYLARNNFTLSPEAHEALSRRLAADHSAHDKNFGNARHVMNIIQTEILPAMTVRVMSQDIATPELLSVIQPEDIPAPASPTKPGQFHANYRA